MVHVKEKAEKCTKLVAKAAESGAIQIEKMSEESVAVRSTQVSEESAESRGTLELDTQDPDLDFVPRHVGRWQVHALESDTEDSDLVSERVGHVQVRCGKSSTRSD
jgi:hypothetical protein